MKEIEKGRPNPVLLYDPAADQEADRAPTDEVKIMDHHNHDHRSEQPPRIPEIKRPANAIKGLMPARRAAKKVPGSYAVKLVGVKVV